MTKKKVPAHVQEALRQQAVKGEIRQPDLARLTAHFFEEAGGERQIARMLFAEFKAAASGSVVRQRILDMIMRALRFSNERTAPPDDLGQLSEADLERELAGLWQEVSGDGDATEQAAGPDPPAGGAPGQGPGLGGGGASRAGAFQGAAAAGAGPAA